MYVGVVTSSIIFTSHEWDLSPASSPSLPSLSFHSNHFCVLTRHVTHASSAHTLSYKMFLSFASSQCYDFPAFSNFNRVLSLIFLLIGLLYKATYKKFAPGNNVHSPSE